METCDSLPDNHQPPSTGNSNCRRTGKVIVAIHPPPPEIEEYLDGHIGSCFPSDPEEVAEQVIEMIEMDMKD
jgi:hypothetical protein